MKHHPNIRLWRPVTSENISSVSRMSSATREVSVPPVPAEPLPSTDSQAPRHDPNPRHDHTVDGSNEPLPDRTSSEKRPARLQRAAKVGGTTSDESPRTYQFPVTGSWDATRTELHSLQCDACWHHGNHTREDCPVRLRSSCLFCGSTEHRRGVDCTRPHVYGQFVVACRVEAFKRKSPKERRRALQATHRRASPLAVVGGGNAVDCDASADGTDGSGATSSSGTRLIILTVLTQPSARRASVCNSMCCEPSCG